MPGSAANNKAEQYPRRCGPPGIERAAREPST